MICQVRLNFLIFFSSRFRGHSSQTVVSGADHRARRRQLAFEDRRDRLPDAVGLGRAAGQIVIDRHRLVQRLERVVKQRQVERPLGHLRLGLGPECFGFSVVASPGRPCRRSLPRLFRLASPGMQPSPAQEPKATSTFALAAEELGHVFLLAGADAAVEQADVDLAVGHFLDVVDLAVDGQGQKTMSKAAATSRIFSLMASTAISQPPQEAAQ